MLKSITMTEEQTETYDVGGERAETLMRELREQARLCAGAADKVEIYTADGIVADYVGGDDYTGWEHPGYTPSVDRFIG